MYSAEMTALVKSDEARVSPCSQIIKLRPVVKNSPLRVGVEKKLRVELRKLNEGVIVKSICEQCVQWSFNLYNASHFGGLWKR